MQFILFQVFQVWEELLLGERALYRGRVELFLDCPQSVLHPGPEAGDLTVSMRGLGHVSLRKPGAQSFRPPEAASLGFVLRGDTHQGKRPRSSAHD